MHAMPTGAIRGDDKLPVVGEDHAVGRVLVDGQPVCDAALLHVEDAQEVGAFTYGEVQCG